MINKLKNMPLLGKVAIAIALGILCSFFFPEFLNRIFVTINGIFGNFLGFIIPLIIVGLVAPGIAELGSGAGRLLAITAAIAYGSTLFAGFFSFFACDFSYPIFLDASSGLTQNVAQANKILPYFTVDMPAVMSVTSALVLAFVLGLGLCAVQGNKLVLNVGFSHPVEFVAPDGIKFECPNLTEVVVSGINKEVVGQTAANIRAIRLPEPYHGYGIRYKGEVIERKEGKTSGKGKK